MAKIVKKAAARKSAKSTTKSKFVSDRVFLEHLEGAIAEGHASDCKKYGTVAASLMAVLLHLKNEIDEYAECPVHVQVVAEQAHEMLVNYCDAVKRHEDYLASNAA